MLDARFTQAFEAAVNNKENLNEDGSVNWNFVDADLWLDGVAAEVGENFMSWFDDMATMWERKINDQ